MKGVLIFIGIVVASVLFCAVVPFVLLPGAGIGMALPVISVPGEVLTENFLGTGITLTNTVVGTVLADILVLLFAFGATRKMSLIPGRLQGLFEVLTSALYSLAKQSAGHNARKLFPLMATIFLFLITANWLELIPGVDSVGVMHCAESGFSGYERNGSILQVDEPLDGGERATEADYEACHAAEESHGEEIIAEGSEVAGEVPGEAESDMPTDRPVRDDIYVVTPFVRAAATDLNLTMGLALIAFVAIQYFGVKSLGPKYFAKFINTPALENAGKNPMGVMDFVVGLLETISEFAKILSFGFRLFGNIFAGQVLLFVMAFLAAFLLPVVFYGFELFVGAIQAFVFGMLLLVFGSMAMEGHEIEDHEGDLLEQEIE
ncbi:F0F1 ATP synthase subunit A [Aggregatilinea lenta]|uniref:F0F1 ATP synthase subunit A n=1 Tax=Aggregatilinea lenta TaxID=913108 RepID=UPI0013C33289|nr:F0F1 ATP synthase subunit A [Aggregatilinea lenta]